VGDNWLPVSQSRDASWLLDRLRQSQQGGARGQGRAHRGSGWVLLHHLISSHLLAPFFHPCDSYFCLHRHVSPQEVMTTYTSPMSPSRAHLPSLAARTRLPKKLPTVLERFLVIFFLGLFSILWATNKRKFNDLFIILFLIGRQKSRPRPPSRNRTITEWSITSCER
jgi:hypothetical protein